MPALSASYGDLYFPLEVPAAAYPRRRPPVPVVGVANVLVVNRSMPEELAYDITRVLFEKQPELAAIHPEARPTVARARRRQAPRRRSTRGAALLLAAQRRQVDADVSLAARAL